jgi:hypothetical protein
MYTLLCGFPPFFADTEAKLIELVREVSFTPSTAVALLLLQHDYNHNAFPSLSVSLCPPIVISPSPTDSRVRASSPSR